MWQAMAVTAGSAIGGHSSGVLASTSLAIQDALLVKAGHHGRDRGVGMLPVLAVTQGSDDIADRSLAALDKFANDRGGQRSENIFEARVPSHGPGQVSPPSSER